MLGHCPKCRAPLTGVIEKPYGEPKVVQDVHVYGGKFVRQYAVALLVGECPRHGFVKTEKITEGES